MRLNKIEYTTVVRNMQEVSLEGHLKNLIDLIGYWKCNYAIYLDIKIGFVMNNHYYDQMKTEKNNKSLVK